MSTIIKKKWRSMNFQIERYESAMEVVEKARTRTITDSRFKDKSKQSFSSWEGVKTYDEALDLMRNGYQPTVDSMKGVFKMNRSGEQKRFSFQNNIQGFAPIVPLALKGVPNSMIDMRMKPIKSKVIDIYYDMTASSGTSSKSIIEAGQNILGTIIELEAQGYRFNLYACQSYSEYTDCDMLAVKVKDASRPVDLKRISFPLTHTAFFRVIGFDWYSRVPGGIYRFAYGRALGYEYSSKELQKMAECLFGGKPVYLTATDVIRYGKDHVKEALGNERKDR